MIYRLVAVAFWIASVSLVFVFLYPEKRKPGCEEPAASWKEQAVIVLSLVVAVSFTVLVLLAFIAGRMGTLDRWWNPTGFKLFGAKRPAAFAVSFVLSLLWWRGVILLQRKRFQFPAQAVLGASLFALFSTGLYSGLVLTEMLWRK